MAQISHEGTHYFIDLDGESAPGQFKVFQRSDGWYWWPIDPQAKTYGPLKSSYAAYLEAQSAYLNGKI